MFITFLSDKYIKKNDLIVLYNQNAIIVLAFLYGKYIVLEYIIIYNSLLRWSDIYIFH